MIKKLAATLIIIAFLALPAMAADQSGDGTCTQAQAAYKAGDYDRTIQLLAGPAAANPYDFKINILLARAQIEKCAAMKAAGNQGYKLLIKQPYVIGRRLHKFDKTRPEPYFVVAKSLLVNNRPIKAARTIKKALYFAPTNPEYLMLQGDIYSELAKKQEYGAVEKAQRAYQQAKASTIDNPELKATIDRKLQQLKDLFSK